jgi:ribosomal protein L11 methyltransferase
MLYIYELKGQKQPRDVPEDGLTGIWPEAPYYYLFYEKEVLGSVEGWLKSNPQWLLTSRYSLPYEKWQDVSSPWTRIGPFAVQTMPCLEKPDAEPGSILLRIDPGVVFGSGLHPTTRGCLLAIAECFSKGEIRTVVDFGTGTGILAIACVLLGARRVRAVDCNPLALKFAGKNASVNNVADRIGFVAADRLGVLNVRSDLLVVNIEWPFLEALLRTEDWKNYGRIILSGFLERKLAMVEEMVRPAFRVSDCGVFDGWPVVSIVSCG